MLGGLEVLQRRQMGYSAWNPLVGTRVTHLSRATFNLARICTASNRICLQVVENMRQGMKPRAAAEDAVRRIARRVPGYVGAVIALDRDGNHAAACHGWTFRYAYRDADSGGVQVVTVDPIPTPARETQKPQKQLGGAVLSTAAEGAE